MSGPGLVKKLLFPAYADAGSSDTYGAKDEVVAEEEAPRDDGAANEPADVTGADSSRDDLQSEATTAIQDNRTSVLLLNKTDISKSKNILQPRQSTPASGPVTLPVENEGETLNTEAKPGASATSSRFFPSTAPLIGRPVATRSSSTTTWSGSTQTPFPATLAPRPANPGSSLTTSNVTATSLEQNPFAHDGDDEVRPFAVGVSKSDNSAKGFDDTRSDAVSDVLSTASEFGTVVNISSRMAEVNAMAMMTPVAIAEEESQTESEQGDGDGDVDVEVEVAASLSLPMLDENENPEQNFASASWDENYAVVNERKMALTNQHASPSAAAMVSAAFRRIGSGGGTLGKSGAVSAPTTPRGAPRVQDYLKSAYRSKDQGTPPSLLFRSPGSTTAEKSANRSKKPMLSPRFTESRTIRHQNSLDSSFLRQGGSLASPLKFAKGCFSFDNTLSDDDSPLQGKQPLRPRIPESTSLSSPLEMQLEPKSTDVRNLIHSKSWDAGSSSLSSKKFESKHMEYASAFRAIPGNTRVLNAGTNYYQLEIEPIKGPQEFSPAINPMENAMALRTPQRVVIEREDALDILACLVERSVAFEKEKCVDTAEDDGHDITKQVGSTADDDLSGERMADDDKVSTFAEVGTRMNARIRSPPKNLRKVKAGLDMSMFESGGLSSDVVDTVNELKDISRVYDDERDHENRMEILDELLRSYVYAGEMKRAARSASTWLRSIGRSSGDNTIHEAYSSTETTDEDGKSPVGSVTDIQTGHRVFAQESDTGTSVFEETMDVLTVRAMLHSVELQLKEKKEESQRLNVELTGCRAEIGRLKSSSNAGFRSPNCSILDDDGDSEESDVGADAVTSIATHAVAIDQSEVSWDEAKIERGLLKTALIEANNTIRKLHATGQQQSLRSGDSFGLPERAPVVPIPDRITKEPINGMPGNSIEVTTTEAESFVTRWSKESPLPPPPDHDLNSPIVTALLKQWTTDSAMHHSLLTWIARVLHGADPDSIPPLTISSLDRPVRVGMLLHVLPLLLKRPDIVLDVQTRAHRRTTYDIAVTVERNLHGDVKASNTPKANNFVEFASNSRHTGALADRSLYMDSIAWKGVTAKGDSEVGTSSVSHSAVTAHVSNSAALFVPVETGLASSSSSRTVVAANLEASVFHGYESTNAGANNQRNGQPGLMSAINSTFGGLLNRGKKVQAHKGVLSKNVDKEGQHTPTPPSYSWNPPVFPSEGVDGDEPQPYQRVLSCPPGRIGVTFVQYRGHAMVSDVSPESPLSGWVFASDILIAIDEVPVSGMRVRDIVRLLTARKDRQRALRVISSHAMNEFTLNTSVLSEPAI